MSGSKRVFHLWALSTPAQRDGPLANIPGLEALTRKEDPQRDFEKLLSPALDWFRYENGLYFIYTDRNDDFWRTRLMPAVDQFLLLPAVHPISGKMDRKLWRWLREVTQFCSFERGDRIHVWPTGKPSNAVSGVVAGFTATGRPSINFDQPMQAFPMDGDLEFSREHPIPARPSDENVLPQRSAPESPVDTPPPAP